MTLHGLILAGGRSTRMGYDKAAIAYHGVPQSQHLAGLLTSCAGKVFVSLRREQHGEAAFAGLTCIVDHYPAASPLNGIASAMRAHPGAAFLVVAVDMPSVTHHALTTLIALRDVNRIATCYESPIKGGPDPLLAIWEARALPALEQALAKAEPPCPRHFLMKQDAACLRHAIAPEVLGNVNTLEEFHAWRQEPVCA